MKQTQPLTETVYYVLLSLLEKGHGYVIMERIRTMSDGRVNMAAGTLYGALDNLQKADWISRVPSTQKRRKVYQITTKGITALKEDFCRMQQLITITKEEFKAKEVG